MTPKEIEEAKVVYKKYEGGKNSYEDAYSNIVKLEKHAETDSSSPKKLLLKTLHRRHRHYKRRKRQTRRLCPRPWEEQGRNKG